MDLNQLHDQILSELKQTTVGYINKHWKVPPAGTHWANAISLLSQLTNVVTPPVVTPPVSSTWSVAPPTGNITNVLSPSGVGLNINNQQNATYTDYIIDNTQDSAILLQGSTQGCILKRFHITKVDALSPSEPYGVHGVYCKSPNNTFSDFFIDGTGGTHYQGSGFSVRMRGNSFYNTIIQNMQFAVSYFEYDHTASSVPVSFINGTWQCNNGDTMVWMDNDAGDGGSSTILQPFHFENINASGCNYFLKINANMYQGPGVVIKNCTLNGKPVTSAMVQGVPSSLLSII